MNSSIFFGRLFSYAALGLLCFVSTQSLAAANNGATEKARVSESRFYSRDGREQLEADRVSTDEYRDNSVAKPRNTQQKSSASAQQAANTDFWFYTADVVLFADEDEDGYFYGIDLLFDADTVYSEAAVYAVLYLSLDGGPWLEYAATEVFDIFGATGEDEFVVVTELLSGYPSGSYDILIELFDTYDGSFVADFGPIDTSELAYLPLEDAERDAPYVLPPPDTTVIINQGGGGAADPWLLVLLATGAFCLRRRYRSQA